MSFRTWRDFPYPGIPEAERESISDDLIIESICLERNRLLAQSDWTQLPDSPVDLEAWAAYRALLRALPGSAQAREIVFPDPPESVPL